MSLRDEFMATDVKDSIRQSGADKITESSMILKTPFTVEKGGVNYPVYGYASVPVQVDGHVLNDRDRSERSNSIELYVDTRDESQRFEKPTVDNYCPEGCKNIEDMDVYGVNYHGRIVSHTQARGELRQNAVEQSNIPHVQKWDSFVQLKELSNQSLVQRGFISEDEAKPTVADYNRYLDSVSNQLRGGIKFNGSIQNLSQMHEAYESVPDVSDGSQPSADKSFGE